MVICPDCGNEVPNAKFCKNCGAHLSEIIEAESSKEEHVVDAVGGQLQSGDVKEEQTQETNENIYQENQNSNGPKFCRNCGVKLDGDYKFCPDCGYELSPSVSSTNNPVVRSTNEKSMLLSVILSFIFPGLGQIYLGLEHKGLIFIIAYIVSLALTLIIIGVVLMFIIWIWALIDTIKSASALNRGEEVKDKLL